MFNFKKLHEIDGRTAMIPVRDPIEPGKHYEGHPMPVQAAVAAKICEEFTRIGHSVHSPRGGTVWIIQEYAKAQGVELSVCKIFSSLGECIGYRCCCDC